MPETIERATRSVETGLGMSDVTYKQNIGEKKITGKVQGKASVPQGLNLQKDQSNSMHLI
jgi:hypothetical protein